jgi:alpha-D-xyloside xylohydrolase
MKFTHGIWFDKEDVAIYNATEVNRISHPKPGEIQALCTTRPVKSRGDTLNKPTITVNLSAQSPNIIRGEAWHFRAASNNDPRFELFPDGEADSAWQPKCSDNTVESGGVIATMNKEPASFAIDYQDGNGKALTRLGFESIQYVVAPASLASLDTLDATTSVGDAYHRSPATHSKLPFMAVSFDLQPGEYVYGLGERFSPLIRNGQTIDLWNEDAGTCTLYAYKNIPFYLTNKGYGVFIDHSDVVSLEIQSEKLAKVQVSAQSERIRWHVIYGPSPKEILARYAHLTGHPALPPAWTFGLYLSSSFLTDYDEKTVTEQLDGMKTRNIPMSVFHFDCFWMQAHSWTNFEFDPVYFPDPKGFLEKLHQRGLRVCVWINSYIAQDSDAFEEAASKGYLLKRKDGSVWQTDNWQAGMGIVDFTNPDATNWYQDQLGRLLDIGVDTFKTDFGERIPFLDIEYHNGKDARAMHNYYSLLYNKAVYEVIVSKRGASEAALFARSATAGGQRYPVHWGGDCECTWNGMAQTLRGGLSFGMSGFGFWSHDIGGFMSEGQAKTVPEAAIYKRWVQFGLLSSHSRLHGSATYRVPWLVDDEASEVLGKFSRLKNSLMPYLYAQAIESHRTGVPMLRAMVLEFPDDRTCQMLDLQYMLGDSLLVAPIFNDEGVADYYVPRGRWRGLLDGKLRTGPDWVTEKHDFLSLPILVREDKAILVGISDRPDYNWRSCIQKVVIGELTSSHPDLAVDVPDANDPGSFAGKLEIERNNAGETVASIDGTRIEASIVTLAEDNHL